MPVDTRINVPFIPQEGITSQILTAIQMANEEHQRRQQFGLQQQELAQRTQYQQGELDVQRTKNDLEAQGLPSEIAERHARAFQAQQLGEQTELQNQQNRALLNALGGGTAPTAMATPQQATSTAGPIDSQQWLQQRVPPAFQGMVGPAISSLGPLDANERTALEGALASAPANAMQKKNIAAYAEPFASAVDTISKARNTPEGLAKRVAAGDPNALAIVSEQKKEAVAKSAESAAAEAKAKYPYELALKQAEFMQQHSTDAAVAVNPQGQQELTDWKTASQKESGFSYPIRLGANAEQVVQKASSDNVRLNEMQRNLSSYKAALNGIQGDISSQDANRMRTILGDSGLGIKAQLWGAGLDIGKINDMIKGSAISSAWNSLSADKQNAVMGYLRMQNTAILWQKYLSDTGRINELAMKTDIRNMPTPDLGAEVGNKQLDIFQENVDQAAQKQIKLPFMQDYKDVRRQIEGKATEDYNKKQPPAAPSTGGYHVGQKIVVGGETKTVTKVSPSGDYLAYE